MLTFNLYFRNRINKFLLSKFYYKRIEDLPKINKLTFRNYFRTEKEKKTLPYLIYYYYLFFNIKIYPIFYKKKKKSKKINFNEIYELKKINNNYNEIDRFFLYCNLILKYQNYKYWFNIKKLKNNHQINFRIKHLYFFSLAENFESHLSLDIELLNSINFSFFFNFKNTSISEIKFLLQLYCFKVK